MTANQILSEKNKPISADLSVGQVMELFKTHKNSGFAVVNQQNVVVGVISPSDLFTKELGLHIPTYIKLLEDSKFESKSSKELPYAAGQLIHATASDVMNQNVYFAHEDTPLEVVAAALANQKQTIVPVVTAENQFIGVIDISEVLKNLAGSTPAPQLPEVSGERPVDQEIGFVRTNLSSKFSFIARSRAQLWLSTTLVLFVIGFGLGIVFIVDPAPIVESVTENIQTLLKNLHQ